MNTQTSSTIHRRPPSPAGVVLRWVLTVVWTVVWVVLYFLCLNDFGNIAAYIGIPALIVLMVIVWFATERRNWQRLEEEV